MIKGQGNMVLKMNFGKDLTINNVLYVLDICKNLVSHSVLNEHSFHVVFKLDIVVLSKHGLLVRKGYVSYKMSKLNVMTIRPRKNNNNNNNNNFVYMLKSSNL